MRIIINGIWLALSLALPVVAAAADVAQITAGSEERAGQGRKAQQKIDGVAEKTDELVRLYRTENKIVDGLKIYNGLLQTQIDNQTAEIGVLRGSIEGVALIERQIIPLIVNMIDSLDVFIHEDMPFLLEERAQRVQRLRSMMDRSDVTAAEKFRRVLEAYQIENEYGRTLEAYKGSVNANGKEREVNFLRVGRIALLYQTFSGDISGAWNKQTSQWEILPPEQYKRQVANGLRIARKQIAPDLLIVPVNGAQEQ